MWAAYWSNHFRCMGNALQMLDWLAGGWKFSDYHPLENPDPVPTLHELSMQYGYGVERDDTAAPFGCF